MSNEKHYALEFNSPVCDTIFSENVRTNSFSIGLFKRMLQYSAELKSFRFFLNTIEYP